MEWCKGALRCHQFFVAAHATGGLLSGRQVGLQVVGSQRWADAAILPARGGDRFDTVGSLGLAQAMRRHNDATATWHRQRATS